MPSRTLDAEDRDLRAFATRVGIFQTPDDMRDREVMCPGGSKVSSGIVYCGIEERPIQLAPTDADERSDPYTYCMRCTSASGYVDCPSWRRGR